MWTDEAKANLEDAIGYVLENSTPEIAERQFRLITVRVLDLERFPAVGRPGQLPGTRELVISDTPYMAIYRLHVDRVEIIALTHGAQLWPKP